MEEKRNGKLSYLLIVSLCLIFTFSIGIKAVYNTALIQIREEYNITNFQTQIGSFIYYGVYAVSQVLLACFIKKLNIKKLFFFSIIASSISYSLMIFADEPWKLWLLLAINGVLQAPHWSGCIYFISRLLKGKYMEKATSSMAIANPLGAAIASGVVAFFIFLNQWRISFVLLAVLMIATAFMFKYAEGELEKVVDEREPEGAQDCPKEQRERVLTSRQKRDVWITVCIMFLITVLTSGGYTIAKQTLSIYLFDMHGVNKSLSVLLSLFLPVVAMLFKLVLLKIYYKHKNYLFLSFVTEIVVVLCTLLLLFTYQDMLIMGLILYTVLYSLMLSGATMLGGSVFGLDIRDKMNAGTSAAILNAGGSIGCATLPLVGGAILDIGGALGWNILFISLAGVVGVVVLILAALLLTKKKNYTFYNENEE